MTCDVANTDCFQAQPVSFPRNKRIWRCCSRYPSPIFDFEFTDTTDLSVASVTAIVAWVNADVATGAEFNSIQIMEDCGGNQPDGDYFNLNNFANPSGCTGEPLPKYVEYTGGSAAPAPTTYTFEAYGLWLGISFLLR